MARRESLSRRDSIARRRKSDEEEAKRLSALVREESMRETSRRRSREQELTKRGSELSGSRREERVPTVSGRQSSAHERSKDIGERHTHELVRVVRDMQSSQPSSVASVPMPKSLPSLASLGQTKNGNEQPLSFEESQGSNKRDMDNPFHRSYSNTFQPFSPYSTLFTGHTAECARILCTSDPPSPLIKGNIRSILRPHPKGKSLGSPSGESQGTPSAC